MKQKFNDFVLLVKHDRKWQALIAILVIMILVTLVAEEGQRYTYSGNFKEEVNTGATSADETSSELLDYFTQLNNKLVTKIEDLEKDREEQLKKQKDYEDRTAQIFQKLVQRMRETEDAMEALASKNTTQIVTDIPENQLVPFGEHDPEDPVAPPIQPDSGKIAFISAGSSVRIKLLAGANAPTDGTPYPVVLKTVSDVHGPDGTVLPIGEARIIAAAQGSLIDQRVLYRLNKMSVRYPNGAIREVGVNGWIVGEDGIRGMEGILIDPIGERLAGEIFAGALQGAGSGLGAQNVTTTSGNNGLFTQEVTQNAAESAAGTAIGNAGNALSGIIQERARLLVPHVKVLSGREATAVFADSVTLPDLFEALDESSTSLAYLD